MINIIPVFAQGEFIIEIDRYSGNFTKTGPAIPGITWIFPDDRAFNENTGTFIFPSADPVERLYSISVSDGSTEGYPIIEDIKAFQYDNTLNKLYAIRTNVAEDNKRLISINTITGALTFIGDPLPSSSIFSGAFSAYDQLNHKYIFISPAKTLYSIDVEDGYVTSSPELVLDDEEGIINYSFDNSTGILYGLLQNNNDDKYYLIKIDTETGTHIKVGFGTSVGNGNGSGTIDELNQHYIYYYSGDGYKINTIDMNTGGLIYTFPVPGLTGLDNVHSLKYDNVQQKLYSIHWDADIPNEISEFDDLQSNLKVYPIPSLNSVTIEFDSLAFNYFNLELFDIHGKLVKIIYGLSENKIELQRGDLSSGLYYFSLESEGFKFAKGKVAFD